jgi:hypothetical protein
VSLALRSLVFSCGSSCAGIVRGSKYIFLVRLVCPNPCSTQAEEKFEIEQDSHVSPFSPSDEHHLAPGMVRPGTFVSAPSTATGEGMHYHQYPASSETGSRYESTYDTLSSPGSSAGPPVSTVGGSQRQSKAGVALLQTPHSRRPVRHDSDAGVILPAPEPTEEEESEGEELLPPMYDPTWTGSQPRSAGGSAAAPSASGTETEAGEQTASADVPGPSASTPRTRLSMRKR